jgi:hypothetical protein
VLIFGTGFLFWQEGELIMGYTQAVEMANLMDLEQGVRWHLQHNHYPPAPSEMIPIAVKAVRLCREDKFDETIVLFFDHQVYEVFGWSVPAYVIVDIYHLEPWVNEEI